MNDSLLSPRHNRPYRAAISAPLLAAAVLLAWLATPLRAAVIDDFSGPKKFTLYSSGVSEYELNGELHCVVPTPGGFGAFWYLSSTYELPEGKPIEFRVDVVALHPAAFVGLAVALPMPPTAPRGSAREYPLFLAWDLVALQKNHDALDGLFFNLP